MVSRSKGTYKGLSEKPVPELPPLPGKPPVTKLPSREILLTAKRCLLARSTNPTVAAFLHVEGLRPKLRKLTREQWDQELEAFKRLPR